AGPALLRRVVSPDRSAIPEARPQHAFRVRPDAARADTLARRIDDRHRMGGGVDMGDVVAGERSVPDLTGGRRGDAVSPGSSGSRPGIDLAGLGVHAPVDAALTGEPDDAGFVEGQRV